MSDVKLTEMVATTAPSTADVMYIVTSPASSPVSKKVTVGDLAAAVPLKVKVGTFTRNITAASGNVSITGVGFTPRALFLSGAASVKEDGYNYYFCDGYSDGTTNQCFAITDNGGSMVRMSYPAVAGLFDGPTQANSATVASFNADGFTLTWTKTATPTLGGTYNIHYMAIG